MDNFSKHAANDEGRIHRHTPSPANNVQNISRRVTCVKGVNLTNFARQHQFYRLMCGASGGVA